MLTSKALPAGEDLHLQARRLSDYCNGFREARTQSAVVQLITTGLPFFLIIGLMYALVGTAYWAVLGLAVPAGLLLTRFFALQHDCGHGSLFPSRNANEWVGRFISVLTFTPYDHWRRSHAIHHAASGNLDRRGYGDIETKTVAEYQAMTRFSRLRYRIYRSPLVVLFVGPPLFFLVLQRLAIGSNLAKRESLPGIMVHNCALLAVYGGLCLLLGFEHTVAVLLPVILVATWIGGWLFFVQHQFENTSWDHGEAWDLKTAALHGSSFLQLPAPFNFLTCNIALHHVHHLCSRIPNYRLQECLQSSNELADVANRISIWEALKCARLALWDEANRKMISFAELSHRQRLVPAGG